MNKDIIILIGPIRTGKSTIASLLSEKLSLQRYSMDLLRFDYYKEIGYNKDEANKIKKEKGFLALCKHWKSYDLYAIQRVLEDCKRGIIDFGGGLSVYENENQLQEVIQLLKDYQVVLLLPSKNKDESIEILNSRMLEKDYQEYFTKEDIDTRKLLNQLFITHPSNYILAKHIFYTKDTPPIATLEEIIKEIDKNQTL